MYLNILFHSYIYHNIIFYFNTFKNLVNRMLYLEVFLQIKNNELGPFFIIIIWCNNLSAAQTTKKN